MDHYATLGVSRTSEDVVIRAAYLALMRRYHPDANPAPDAARRAREVTTAYEVLSDKDKRAEYDRRRDFDPSSGPAFVPRKRTPVGPIFFAATMVLLSLAILALWMKPAGTRRSTPPAEASSAGAAAPLSEASCAWPNATEAVSQELLRQAGRLRAVDRRALAMIAPQMVVRMTPAMAGRGKQDAGRVDCTATVQLTLPVGVTLPDGRQTFGGDIAYSLRGDSRSGSPRVIFAPADELAVQLASLRPPAPPAPEAPPVELADAAPLPPPLETRQIGRSPQVAQPAAPLSRAPALRASPPRPAPTLVRTTTARPVVPPPARPVPVKIAAVQATSKKAAADPGCGKFGSKWTELMCQNKGLAALDQQLGAFDAQSWSRASADKREQLRRSRGQFSATRIQCTSEACLRQLYLARMRTVADIMAKPDAAGSKTPAVPKKN